MPHFWVLRLEEFKTPTSGGDYKGPFECNRGEAARKCPWAYKFYTLPDGCQGETQPFEKVCRLGV